MIQLSETRIFLYHTYSLSQYLFGIPHSRVGPESASRLDPNFPVHLIPTLICKLQHMKMCNVRVLCIRYDCLHLMLTSIPPTRNALRKMLEPLSRFARYEIGINLLSRYLLPTSNLILFVCLSLTIDSTPVASEPFFNDKHPQNESRGRRFIRAIVFRLLKETN